jgi:hypothetical protein
MNDAIKVQIAAASIEALFLYGLPTMVKLVNNLNSQEKITLEDIQKITEKMKKSEDYFK